MEESSYHSISDTMPPIRRLFHLAAKETKSESFQCYQDITLPDQPIPPHWAYMPCWAVTPEAMKATARVPTEIERSMASRAASSLNGEGPGVFFRIFSFLYHQY